MAVGLRTHSRLGFECFYNTYIVQWLYQTIYSLVFFLLSVVMPSGFALFFVECFIRLHLLEIIGIEPNRPLVRLSR